jgi:hypothetical protein
VRRGRTPGDDVACVGPLERELGLLLGLGMTIELEQRPGA